MHLLLISRAILPDYVAVFCPDNKIRLLTRTFICLRSPTSPTRSGNSQVNIAASLFSNAGKGRIEIMVDSASKFRPPLFCARVSRYLRPTSYSFEFPVRRNLQFRRSAESCPAQYNADYSAQFLDYCRGVLVDSPDS